MKAIGKYQIIDEIGAGSAGTTYRVRDTSIEREFALKVLFASNTTSPEVKDQFCRKLAGYSELRHPHIAKLHDVGEADGALYVATELLNGIDLRKHLDERRVLPIEHKLEFAAQICDALTVPHSKGIAHGNLKPTNIFVVAGKNAKILDFGSGKWLELVLAAGGKPPSLLPNYLAPEQILGKGFDARSDLFAIGMILYEVLTGRYPYKVAANLIPREIVHSEPEPLRTLDAEMPEELDRLVARALHKDPEQRLQSVVEFTARLNEMAQKIRDLRTAPSPAPAPVLNAPAMPAPAPIAPEKPVLATVAAPAPPITEPTPMPIVPMTAEIVAEPQKAPSSALAVIKTASQPPSKTPLRGPQVQQLRRVVTIALAGILAIAIVVVLLSRQSSEASQGKTQQAPAPVAQPVPVAPAAPMAATPEPSPAPTQPADTTTVQPAQPQPVPTAPAAVAPIQVKPAPELILRGRVRTLWEAGKYAQAMALVDQILAENPDHSEARAWKKKIRAAQDAENAIK